MRNKPLILSRQSDNADKVLDWMKKANTELNIVATYSLVYNAALMTSEGFGYTLTLDKLVNVTGDSDLCFRPLKDGPKLPVFLDSLPDGSGALQVRDMLSENRDGFAEQDLERLKMYFSQVGTADRVSELKRLRAVRAYFERRLSEERPGAEKHASLSRRLGALCGILFAVMLI